MQRGAILQKRLNSKELDSALTNEPWRLTPSQLIMVTVMGGNRFAMNLSNPERAVTCYNLLRPSCAPAFPQWLRL